MKEKILRRVTLQIQQLWATPVSNASEAHFRAEKLTRLGKIKDKLYDNTNQKLAGKEKTAKI